MPELPEVEVTKIELVPHIVGNTIKKIIELSKAGANALTEAKCLYEKNIDFKSDKLKSCLKGNSE